MNMALNGAVAIRSRHHPRMEPSIGRESGGIEAPPQADGQRLRRPPAAIAVPWAGSMQAQRCSFEESGHEEAFKRMADLIGLWDERGQIGPVALLVVPEPVTLPKTVQQFCTRGPFGPMLAPPVGYFLLNSLPRCFDLAESIWTWQPGFDGFEERFQCRAFLGELRNRYAVEQTDGQNCLCDTLENHHRAKWLSFFLQGCGNRFGGRGLAVLSPRLRESLPQDPRQALWVEKIVLHFSTLQNINDPRLLKL